MAVAPDTRQSSYCLSTQGLTLKGGVVADLRRAGGMTDDIWWLNVYVLLSRPTQLSNLILAGLDDKLKNLLEGGPPKYIRAKIQQLQTKAQETAKRAAVLAASLGL